MTDIPKGSPAEPRLSWRMLLDKLCGVKSRAELAEEGRRRAEKTYIRGTVGAIELPGRDW